MYGNPNNKIPLPSELATRKAIKNAAREADLMAITGMNRHQRRALVKVNHVKKIAGTNRPIMNEKATD